MPPPLRPTLALAFLVACSSPSPEEPPPPSETGGAEDAGERRSSPPPRRAEMDGGGSTSRTDAGDSDPLDGSRPSADTTDDAGIDRAILTIATFNIQVLGPAKSGKPDVMTQIAAIVRKYDVVAVQEIKDVSGGAATVLLDSVNALDGPDYGMLLSPRTGQQPDDQSFQEQYAVLYDTTVVEALGGDTLFDDSTSDAFQREPYIARLRVLEGSFSFVLIGIHTRPDSAVEEIGALHDVVEWGRARFSTEDDFIVLGDFNAGCSYASTAELDALPLRGPEYLWIVPDDADTNVATGSACAYDRIVVTDGARADYAGSWGVDEAFTDTAVSDHWPVWAEFWVGRD